MKNHKISCNKHEKDGLFIIGDWNAEVGRQDIPRITDKFGLGVQNEAGQMLTEFLFLCGCGSDHQFLVAKFRLK